MQKPGNDDTIWDELDDADFQECILKEHEYLLQNPSILDKTIKNNVNPVEKNNSNQFNNRSINPDHFNDSFITMPKYGAAARNSSTNSLNNLKDKKTSYGNNHFSFDNSFPKFSKSQSFYKPLEIVPTLSSFKSCAKASVRRKDSSDDADTFDIKALHDQLKIALQEKGKLEEENLVKKGEVLNLRNELKRKEACLDSERVDQCIALEAAEKRGQEKVMKTVAELELKVKSLEKEVDKHQSNLAFKTGFDSLGLTVRRTGVPLSCPPWEGWAPLNSPVPGPPLSEGMGSNGLPIFPQEQNKEVEELLGKCKHLVHHSGILLNNSQRFNEKSPSPKRRRMNLKTSPPKSVSNFASRFDFGEKKKASKNVEIQTECETKNRKRKTLQVICSRGRTTGSQKAFYLLSSGGAQSLESPKPDSGKERDQASLLAQIIFAGNLSLSSDTTEQQLIEVACDTLENLLKDVENKAKSNEKSTLFSSSALSDINVLSVAQSRNETTSHTTLQTLSTCLQVLLKEPVNNLAVAVSLAAVSSLAEQCSDIPDHLCKTMIDAFKTCCQLSTIDATILKNLFTALNTLVSFENFKQNVCRNAMDQCFLRRLCNLFQNTHKTAWNCDINNQAVTFLAALLHYHGSFVKSRECTCPSALLSAYLNHLYYASKQIRENAEEWFSIICGVRLLHLWQSKDKNWWDRVPHIHSCSALLSTVIRKSKYLKAQGILDQSTWELLYDLHDIDETAV